MKRDNFQKVYMYRMSAYLDLSCDSSLISYCFVSTLTLYDIRINLDNIVSFNRELKQPSHPL